MCCVCIGNIPDWLSGEFLSNTPAMTILPHLQNRLQNWVCKHGMWPSCPHLPSVYNWCTVLHNLGSIYIHITERINKKFKRQILTSFRIKGTHLWVCTGIYPFSLSLCNTVLQLEVYMGELPFILKSFVRQALELSLVTKIKWQLDMHFRLHLQPGIDHITLRLLTYKF